MSPLLYHIHKRIAAIMLLAALACGAIAPAGRVRDGAVPRPPPPYKRSRTAGSSKWSDPAQAHALHGTLVLRRQSEAAVELVQPADPGADIALWLHRLRSTPGIEYVHPNYSCASGMSHPRRNPPRKPPNRGAAVRPCAGATGSPALLPLLRPSQGHLRSQQHPRLPKKLLRHPLSSVLRQQLQAPQKRTIRSCLSSFISSRLEHLRLGIPCVSRQT